MAVGCYPHNYEEVLGFGAIRKELAGCCQNEVGTYLVARMAFLTDAEKLRLQLAQLSEMMWLVGEGQEVPSFSFLPIREALVAIRPEGTYISVEGLVALGQVLARAKEVKQFFEGRTDTPELCRLAERLEPLPRIRQRIHNLVDDEGEIKDSASRTLREIRGELRALQNSLGRTMQSVLRQAQIAGHTPADATPAMRDGRLLLPITPAARKEVPGIVHEQSSTGQTLYVEPIQLVETNNQIKDKQSEERREIVRLLKEFTSILREEVPVVQNNCTLLGLFDFINAKMQLAVRMDAVVPAISSNYSMEWYVARHPLLERRLKEEGRALVPLSVKLSHESRILLISGPNAGGKSVALKTVGLLQYMLQCGLALPMQGHSSATIFEQIFLNIGDQQSIENDLSTYSSHLQAMKFFVKNATDKTLVLIDEFGAGTEPTIGGAIAESVLEQLRLLGTYGVITTHYGNLKSYVERHEGLVNAAMLFDRGEIKPLYELYVGQPGSSFAIEIARKNGLPEEILAYAEEIVGQEYMQQDKFLQDIIRDKAYWNRKRQTIRREEKRLEEKIAKLNERLENFSARRDSLLKKAEQEALAIVQGANAAVERTIREIKSKGAEKQATKAAREQLEKKKEALQSKQKKAKNSKPQHHNIEVGSSVRLEQGNVVGEVLALKGKKAEVRMGNITMSVPLEKLRLSTQQATEVRSTKPIIIATQAEERKLSFKPQIDCRGMRVEEALQKVTLFIDDAVHFGYSPIRILHGTGTGALKEAIAKLLQEHRAVAGFKEEHVDFGGAGITVVELK